MINSYEKTIDQIGTKPFIVMSATQPRPDLDGPLRPSPDLIVALLPKPNSAGLTMSPPSMNQNF